ncbi:hypothetical protein HHX47_DHR6000551, partial [Lentinula edodes]
MSSTRSFHVQQHVHSPFRAFILAEFTTTLHSALAHP